MSTENKSEEKKMRKRGKINRGFKTYIFKVLKQVHPDTRISSASLNQVSELLELLAIKIAETANTLSKQVNRATINSRDIQSAIRILLPGELSKHAVSEGTKAVTKYIASIEEKSTGDKKKPPNKGKNRKPSERTERKAGLTFPVARCKKYIKFVSGGRVGEGAPVYLAAVLEYICAEILELSGNCARDKQKVTIVTRHIFLCVANDEELSRLFSQFNVEFSKSGVVSKINVSLLPGGKDNLKDDKSIRTKPKKRSTKKEGVKSDVKKPHKFRPGTVALREVRKQQKSTALQIQKAVFERIVREISKPYSNAEEGMRFSKDVIVNLQSFIESCIVHIYSDAQDLACYANRQGISENDILFCLKHSSMGFHKFDIPSLRKSDEQISKEPLQRLARRGGAKRCKKNIYDISRRIIDGIITEIIRKACIMVEHARCKTLNQKILSVAIKECGFNYLF